MKKKDGAISPAKANRSRSPLRILDWLPQVREAAQPLNDREPVWINHGVLHSGPPMQSPERHPYYELAFKLAGRGIQTSGSEQATMHAGAVFLAGPGVPHHHQIEKYPHRFVTLYFLPQVFLSPGLGVDGLHVLRRFSMRQPLRERIIHPPKPLLKRLGTRLTDMIDTFERKPFGYAMTLQSGLFDITLSLMNWERAKNKRADASFGRRGKADRAAPVRWDVLSAAVRFLEERASEPLYARDVAKAAGVTEDELKRFFHDAIGVTWVHYLQALRIRAATALLIAGTHNVTEAALAAGFESLSHFNATFHRFMGFGPTAYMKTYGDTGKGKN